MAAECYFCPHPAAEHDERGCGAPTMGAGVCSCTTPLSKLPPPPAVDHPEVVPSEVALELLGVDSSQLPPVDRPAGPTEVELEAARELAAAEAELLEHGIRVPASDSVPAEPQPVLNGVPYPPTPSEPAPTEPDTGDTLEDTSDTPGHTSSPAGESPERPDHPVTEAAESSAGAQLQPARAWPIAGGKVPESRNYDWPAIKARYVEGFSDPDKPGSTVWPSMAEVARHFEVRDNRVREKAAAEGWVGARQQYQARVERTRQQARMARMAQDGALIDDKALKAATMGLELCLAELAAIGQRAQAARSANAGNPNAKSGISSLEMQRFAAAADAFHRIGLRATGVDSDVQRLEITGANGAPIEIAQELRRDDPTRLAGVLAVLEQAGLGARFGIGRDGARPLEAHRGADGVYATE